MPLIDVTELFTDPDFATRFDVTRSTIVLGEDGRSVEIPTVTSGIAGSVQPAGPTALQRLPEGSSLTGAVEIYTTFRLSNGDETTSADVVTWQGAPYTVMDVADWTQFGAGFVLATCVLGTLNR